jgi:hypothetical protein
MMSGAEVVGSIQYHITLQFLARKNKRKRRKTWYFWPTKNERKKEKEKENKLY